MSEDRPYELKILFRASHSTLWELADKCGILASHSLSIKSMEFAASSEKAEGDLFSGAVDFVAGNHISPYYWVALGKPIVALASPGNRVRDRVISKQSFSSLADFKDKGLRIADTGLIDPDGTFSHTRGNHILDLLRAGYAAGEVDWMEAGQPGESGTVSRLVEAVKKGEADLAFGARGDTVDLEKEGLHSFWLPELPMVNGTTITTSYEALNQKQGLAPRLVRALVETIHYARVHPEESQRFLDTKIGRPYQENGGRASGVARYPMKPYPTTEGVANAYELCCMQHEETHATSPFALWDMSYLRALDLSGFIDELIQEQPESARYAGTEPSWIG